MIGALSDGPEDEGSSGEMSGKSDFFDDSSQSSASSDSSTSSEGSSTSKRLRQKDLEAARKLAKQQE